jgi:hypothetical protein
VTSIAVEHDVEVEPRSAAFAPETFGNVERGTLPAPQFSRLSKVHAEVPCNHDHDDHNADDVKNVHCALQRRVRDFNWRNRFLIVAGSPSASEQNCSLRRAPILGRAAAPTANFAKLPELSCSGYAAFLGSFGFARLESGTGQSDTDFKCGERAFSGASGY